MTVHPERAVSQLAADAQKPASGRRTEPVDNVASQEACGSEYGRGVACVCV